MGQGLVVYLQAGPLQRLAHNRDHGTSTTTSLIGAPVMEAKLVRRVAEDAWTEESLFETVIDPLVHAQRSVAFVF